MAIQLWFFKVCVYEYKIPNYIARKQLHMFENNILVSLLLMSLCNIFLQVNGFEIERDAKMHHFDIAGNSKGVECNGELQM